MKDRAKPPHLVWLIIILLILLGSGAIAGGASFMLSPDGYVMGIPLEHLKTTPFSNYFIPGLVLFTCNGLYPFFVAYCMIKRPDWKIVARLNPFQKLYWAWSTLILSGVFVSGWIIMQFFWLGYLSFLQPFYFFYGIALIVLGILPQVRQFYSIN